MNTSDHISIRPARTDDADAIASLAFEVQEFHVAARPDIFKPGGCDTAEDITGRISTDGHFYLVAVCDGVIIGYAYAQVQHEPETRWKYAARTFVIDQMGVNGKYRGQGAGTQLLEALHDIAAAQNVDRMLIHVWAFNPAQRLYERFGFAPFNRKMVVEMGRVAIVK